MSDFVVGVDAEYVESLADDGDFLDDNVLSREEIAQDPDAAAFALTLQQNIAESLGMDADLITINVRG
eukprot:SAG11_NODE_33414_length_277_cov_1.084270_1_plen_68_part_00